MNPLVSVIIPVYNDRNRLIECLKSLAKQTYDNYEVIVVDNNSVDDLWIVCQQFGNTHYLLESKQGSYAARNYGVSAAKGEIIAFTDSDCQPSPNWIESGVTSLLYAPNVGLVAGHIEMTYQKDLPSPIEYLDRVLHLNQSSYAQQGYAATGNAFTWSWMFAEVGMFDDSMLSLGDREWGERVSGRGYSAVYSSDALVCHPARSTLRSLLKKVRLQAQHKPLLDNFSKGQIVALLKPLAREVWESLKTDSNLPTLRSRVVFILLLYLIRYSMAWKLLLYA